MEFKGFEEKVKTPELGGVFEDLILIVKPNLMVERNKRNQKYLKSKYDPDSKKEVVYYDLISMNRDFITVIVDHIVGWENMCRDGKEEKFTEALRNHFFINLKNEKTGHELELPVPESKRKDKKDTEETEVRIATLEEYTNKFINDIENFKKN